MTPSETPAPTVPANRPEVLAAIRHLAAQQMGIDPAEVNAESRLVEDLNMDSLDRIEFAMEIEEAYDIHVPDQVQETIVTIAQATEVVMGLLARPGA